MTVKTSFLAVTFVVGVGATLGGMASASAEFFGCNDPPHRVLSSSTQSYNVPARRETRRSPFEFGEQRTRHANYSERGTHRVADQWR